MKLNENEKKTLKLLIENARMPDSKIASILNISSQAVGKIRRKLEEKLIDSYTLNLDYSKLGINTFAIAIAKLTKEGMNKGEIEVEKNLMNIPHIISIYRIPKGSLSHIILYGFKDMNELDEFFHSPETKRRLHDLIETQELFTFSHSSLIKNDPAKLFHKVIDELDKR